MREPLDYCIVVDVLVESQLGILVGPCIGSSITSPERHFPRHRRVLHRSVLWVFGADLHIMHVGNALVRAISLSDAFRTPMPDSCPVTSRSSLGRRAAIWGTAIASHSVVAAASAATWENPFAPPDRNGLKSRPLEQLRILLQDEADAIQFGGTEGLAPGGAPPATGLSLIPIIQMRQKLKAIEPRLAQYDSSTWSDVARELSTGSFETVEFKRVFNAFSDNICACQWRIACARSVR